MYIFYCPPVTPGTHDSIILSELETTIEALPPSKFILLGDFNIDRSNYQHPLLPSLQYIEDKFGLVQVVTSDTKCSLHSSTLIDQVYLSEGVAMQHYRCDTFPPKNSSDHRTLSITIHLKPPLQAKHQLRKLWFYKKADFDSAKYSLNWILSPRWSPVSLDNVGWPISSYDEGLYSLQTYPLEIKQNPLPLSWTNSWREKHTHRMC